MKTTALAIATFALLGLGCEGAAVDDLGPDVIDTAGKADGVVRPVGSFWQEGAAPGEPLVVVLKTDMTFHYETLVVCVVAPCNPIAHDGTYAWSKSGTTRYIRFLDAEGNLIERFAYKLSGDTLKLRAKGATAWLALDRKFGEGWCAAAEDCWHQEITTVSCMGRFTCEANACAFECARGNTCDDITCVEGQHCEMGYPMGIPTAECVADDPPEEQTLAELCTGTGGTVDTALCCGSASDFPNLCLVGPCGCAPNYSKDISVCRCPTGECFTPEMGCAPPPQ